MNELPKCTDCKFNNSVYCVSPCRECIGGDLFEPSSKAQNMKE